MKNEKRRDFLKLGGSFLMFSWLLPFFRLFKGGQKEERLARHKARHYKKLAG